MSLDNFFNAPEPPANILETSECTLNHHYRAGLWYHEVGKGLALCNSRNGVMFCLTCEQTVPLKEAFNSILCKACHEKEISK